MIFEEKLMNLKRAFDFFYNFSQMLLILRIIQLDTTIIVHRSSCKVPIILVIY